MRGGTKQKISDELVAFGVNRSRSSSLQAAQKRGIVFSALPCLPMAEAVAAIKLKAQAHAENLQAIVEDVRSQGITSIRKIAEELNRRGILTPRGGE